MRLCVLITVALTALPASSQAGFPRDAGLPPVEVGVLMAKVDSLAHELQAEAERLCAEEGAEAAAERLIAEAGTDAGAAPQLLNLAAVVAAVAGRTEFARSLVQDRMVGADDGDLVLPLARHRVFAQVLAAGEAARTESAGDLALQAVLAPTRESFFERAASVLALLTTIAPGSVDCARACIDLGAWSAWRGDLRIAFALFDHAVPIYERWAPDSKEMAVAYRDVGGIYYLLGDWERAHEFYDKDLAATRRAGLNTSHLGDCYANLGGYQYACGDYGAALDLHTKALGLREAHLAEAGDDWASDALVQSLVALGNCHLALADADRALEVLRRAANRQVQPPTMAALYQTLGRAYLASGDAEVALNWLAEALGPGRTALGGSASHAEVAGYAAVAAATIGDTDTALARYAEAVDALDTARIRAAASGDEGARRGLAGQYEWIYRDYIGLLIEVGDAAEAAHVDERMRAKGLRDALFARVASHEGAGNIADEWELLSASRAVAVSGPLDDLRHQTLARLDAVDAALRERARREAPALAGLLFPEVTGVEGLQALLGPGDVALAYVLPATRPAAAEAGDEEAPPPGTSLLILTRDEPVVACRLQVTPDDVRDLLFWEPEDGVPSYKPELQTACEELWERLLAPAAERLEGKKRVLILPDGILHSVPWAALTDSDGNCLIDRAAVALLPSVTTLGVLRTEADMRAANLPQREQLCAIGDPEYPGQPAEYHGADDLTRALGTRSPRASLLDKIRNREPVLLEALPGTRLEVDKIGETLGCPAGVFVGVDATEETARSRAVHARYVHFACHAHFDSVAPLDSGLILGLAGADPDNTSRDGFLTAQEVLRMALDGQGLNADMVVLSACQTAVGRDAAAEGLIGLTRAFMFAGTPTVVSTLWPVHDDSSRELMVRFYRNLVDGMDKAEALRQAQLSILDDPQHDWSSPTHWAPFVLWGDW